MQKNLQSHRKSYERSALTQAESPSDPMQLFDAWFSQAEQEPAIAEANAMTLATTGADGYPKARVVLLKEFHSEGWVFYTNYSSDKGRAIAADPRVCLAFFWPPLERQVIIRGKAEKLPAATSDNYFHSRPRGSQLGALASDQSREVPDREFLDGRLEALEKQYEGQEIPRPPDWGGYLVRPETIEFWQGRPNRMHDRILYQRKSSGAYQKSRLAP